MTVQHRRVSSMSLNKCQLTRHSTRHVHTYTRTDTRTDDARYSAGKMKDTLPLERHYKHACM